MMQARFGVVDEQGAWVDEAALAADVPHAAALLADPPRVEGGMVIEDPDTGARADVGDTLGPLIAALCGPGLDRLERDGRNEVQFLDRADRLTITLEGEAVRLRQPEHADAEFPRAGYVQAMRACGARYQALVDAIGDLGPDGPPDEPEAA